MSLNQRLFAVRVRFYAAAAARILKAVKYDTESVSHFTASLIPHLHLVTTEIGCTRGHRAKIAVWWWRARCAWRQRRSPWQPGEWKQQSRPEFRDDDDDDDTVVWTADGRLSFTLVYNTGVKPAAVLGHDESPSVSYTHLTLPTILRV